MCISFGGDDPVAGIVYWNSTTTDARDGHVDEGRARRLLGRLKLVAIVGRP